MSTMTAALYDGTSRMDVVEIEKPEPGPGDVILRVRCTGICGSDLLMNLDKTEPDRFPAGHEVAGEVVDVGDAHTLAVATRLAGRVPPEISVRRADLTLASEGLTSVPCEVDLIEP